MFFIHRLLISFVDRSSDASASPYFGRCAMSGRATGHLGDRPRRLRRKGGPPASAGVRWTPRAREVSLPIADRVAFCSHCPHSTTLPSARRCRSEPCHLCCHHSFWLMPPPPPPPPLAFLLFQDADRHVASFTRATLPPLCGRADAAHGTPAIAHTKYFT